MTFLHVHLDNKIILFLVVAGFEDSNIINQKLDTYKSKYKTERMEKSDKPKETSPEKKFITDTLQKEQTGIISKHLGS